MRILSKNQFAMSNFSRDGYEFNEIEGTFKGTMRFAVWGRKCNAIAYVELDDGRKIMCTAQQPDNYLGIPEIDFGTRVEVVYERGKRGNILPRLFCLKAFMNLQKRLAFCMKPSEL